jgi:hypothetical protein
MAKLKGRGEAAFVGLPRLGAAIYDRLMQGSPMQLYYKEIALDLVSKINRGRLLDIGTGPG